MVLVLHIFSLIQLFEFMNIKNCNAKFEPKFGYFLILNHFGGGRGGEGKFTPYFHYFFWIQNFRRGVVLHLLRKNSTIKYLKGTPNKKRSSSTSTVSDKIDIFWTWT